MTAREAVCQCCFRLPHPFTRPRPWSSTYCQCSGPWHFRKTLVHKDSKSCSYLPECWHHLNLLFWKGVRVNSSSAQTQCSCPWWFPLSSLIINASSPCQHFWVDLYILEHFDISAVDVSFCSSQGYVPTDVKQSDFHTSRDVSAAMGDETGLLNWAVFLYDKNGKEAFGQKKCFLLLETMNGQVGTRRAKWEATANSIHRFSKTQERGQLQWWCLACNMPWASDHNLANEKGSRKEGKALVPSLCLVWYGQHFCHLRLMLAEGNLLCHHQQHSTFRCAALHPHVLSSQAFF